MKHANGSQMYQELELVLQHSQFVGEIPDGSAVDSLITVTLLQLVLAATNRKGIVRGHQRQPCCICWPPAVEAFPEKFSFFFLFSLFLSLSCFFFFLKTYWYKILQDLLSPVIQSQRIILLANNRLTGNLQAGHWNMHSICRRVRPTDSTLLLTGYKFAVFTVLYQLFLEGLLVLRKFSLLQGFVCVVTRWLFHFRRMANRIQHRCQLSTWAHCFRTIFFGFSNSTVFWNNFEMKV